MEERSNNYNNNRSEYIPTSEITLKSLLEAGSHFGSKTSNWHPKASPFIYGVKKDIYIIDLEKTIKIWQNKVRPAIVEAAKSGKTILFVGTKKQGREALTESAVKSGSPFINARWRAGLLTNFKVVRKSVETLEDYESQLLRYEAGEHRHMTKQEANLMRKEVEKLKRDCDGVRSLKKLPDFIFVTDANEESLAVTEAKKLNIPVIALVDTNVDPTTVDYPLPANDDAVKTIGLFARAIAAAIIDGKNQRVILEPEKASEVSVELTDEAQAAVDAALAKTVEDAGIAEKNKAVKPELSDYNKDRKKKRTEHRIL